MKRIKKILVTLVITALAANFLVGIGNVGQAFDWDSGAAWGKAIGGLFNGGGKGSLSFTNYEGGLATLDAEGYDSALTASSDLKGFVLKVVNFALGFLGLIAVLMIIYAGVTYVTSAGQDEKTGNAKKTITYAAIGLLIVLGSFAFVNTIIKAALVGNGGQGSQGQFGQNYGNGFNAIAEEVKGIAVDIYTGYVFLANSTESFKNIQADATNSSLQRASLPAKATIIAFLQDTKGKLTDIRSNVGQLTGVKAAINDRIRAIDQEIDKINNIFDSKENSYLKSDGTTVSLARTTWGEWGAFWNGTVEGATGTSVPESDGYVYFEGGVKLLDEWDTYKSSAFGFDDIIPLLGSNYSKQLQKNLDRLVEINNSIKSITAVSAGAAKIPYENMLGTGSQVGSVYDGETYGALLTEVMAWTIDSEIDVIAETNLLPGLEAHSKYYTALLNLQFVKAVLSADKVRGNQGMDVIFDVGNSSDPAGGSIQSENIIWDPSGALTINGVLSLANLEPNLADAIKVLTNATKSVTCTKGAEGIAATGLKCTFLKPGTYLATVIINSNDSDNYGPGVSFLKIVVNPPTTKIDLKAKIGEDAETKLMYYADDSAISEDGGDEDTVAESQNVDVSRFVIVDTEVQNLKFDASATKASSFKWTFGNGEMLEWAASNAIVNSKQFGEYGLGSYQVTLEVMNDVGIVDKKIFTLVVKNVAANIAEIKSLADGNSVMVNDFVTFDGTGSLESRGNKIKNYKWEVYALDENDKIKGKAIEESSGMDKKEFTYQFLEAGWYTVKLTVDGSATGPDNSDTTEPGLKIHVTSQPPKSDFDYEIPEETLPGTVYFTNQSSDPDSTELEYTWSIDPAQKDVEGKNSVKNWAVATGSSLTAENPIVKFNEKGTYKVKLKVHVKDMPADEEVAESEQEVVIDNTLDVAWDTVRQKGAGKTNEDFSFYLKSENAVSYEIAFGDGEEGSGVNPAEGIKHQYKQAGKYEVEVTVFDEEDEGNMIKKRILIGGGDLPVAYANLLVNNAEITDNTKTVEVIRTDKLVFSGDKSINMDGTGKNLKYNWDFGDTEKSSLKESQHSYSELSPSAGFYVATLSVYDEDAPSKTSQDSVQVNVCPAPPTYSYIEAKPRGQDTPVVVDTKVYGVKDPDNGKIVKYRWWYFDTKKPEEEKGMVVTTDSKAQLTIGSYGDSGAKVEYGIGLEITDDDGLVYCNMETCRSAMIASYKQYPTCTKLKALGEKTVPNNYPKVTVKNEKNESPVAKFTVNPPKAFTGEDFTFTSASTDSDGKIMKYQWDFEGNGFSDNAPVSEAKVTHKYTAKNMEGYAVKLKVTDDKGGEATSEVTKVYVDALSKAPVSAFKNEVVAGTNGKTIKFANKSKPDETAGAKLIKYSWDFDLNTDSDGDGNKTNDVDENVSDPQHRFEENGTYEIKLTITDDQGNKDEVTNKVTVPLANPPKTAFKCEINNATVTCHDLSVADAASKAEIKSRVWDFDTTSNAETADLNGDNDKTNDEDSKDKDATYTYAASGPYKVKLTVTDDQGNVSELYKDVTVSMTGGTSSVEADSSAGTGSDPATGTSTGKTGDTNPVGLGVGLETKNNTGTTTTTTTTTPLVTPPVIKIEKMIPLAVITILEANGRTITTPVPDKDGIIYLTDAKQMPILNFTSSTGPIAYYIVDKNINYDSNGDGIKDNDEDYKTNLKGTYQTKFDRTIGDTHVIKITVVDIYGNKEFITKTIKFK